MAKDTAETLDDEEDVQEVRCQVTGVPIPSVPSWYASVRVKFVSDHGRGKSTPVLRIPEAAEIEAEESDASNEISLEDVEEDLVVEDIEIELDDADVEAEVASEE